MCVCSKIVTLYPIEIKSLENKLTSVCWTNDDNLLLCDEFSNVCSISADGSNRNVLIEGNSKSTTHDNHFPFVVAFKDGLFLVNTRINETAVRHIYINANNKFFFFFLIDKDYFKCICLIGTLSLSDVFLVLQKIIYQKFERILAKGMVFK